MFNSHPGSIRAQRDGTEGLRRPPEKFTSQSGNVPYAGFPIAGAREEPFAIRTERKARYHAVYRSA